MFLQICLLTAGLHYGRKLCKEWRGSAADPEGEEASKEASPSPSATAHAEEAAVQEQLELALASTGLTLTASVAMPQLRFLGGVSVMYGSIPIFRKGRDLIVEQHRVG